MKFKETKDKHGFTVIEMIPETQEEIEEQEKQGKWWDEVSCHCEEDHGTYYVPDGKSKVCDKHHWNCNKCHKIVQIG